MDAIVSLFHRIIDVTYRILTSIFVLLNTKKSLCYEKAEVLKWVSESCGTEIRSLQQLWTAGPNTLGKYIESLNNQSVTWWTMQDLARSSYAVPQVMSRREMERRQLRGPSEKKFLRLLLRLKEALERSSDFNNLRVSSDLFAKGVALSAAYVGMRGVFFVYSYRNQLEGVQIQMFGPGNVIVETKLRTDGLMVSYTVDKSGMYVLEISKNNWFVPGSPFQVNVQDPPVGYKGNFGGNLWDKPYIQERYNRPIPELSSRSNSLKWEFEDDPPVLQKPIIEPLPSRPKRKSENAEKQQIVELSHIAAAIILARRFTNRMHSKIPELRLERTNDQQTELNLWSNVISSPSLREITYVSPEGATFPISVSSRSNEETPKKWNEHGNQSLEDWLVGQTAEYNRESGSCLYPSDRNVFPRNRQACVMFPKRSPNVRPVRPFNQQSATGSSGSETESMKRRADGRIWTHCVSIGVNTDERWVSNSELKKEYRSHGVQVGESLLCCQSNKEYNNGITIFEEYVGNNCGSFLQEQSNQGLIFLRAGKCDTFNSDDTSSSVTTNYSEKIIEMDLKVHYETLAVTSTDDECSHLETARQRNESRRLISSLDLTVGGSSSKIDGKYDHEECFGSAELLKRKSVDGIYQATLMCIDSSPSKSDIPVSAALNVEGPANQKPKKDSFSEIETLDEISALCGQKQNANNEDELQRLKFDYDLFTKGYENRKYMARNEQADQFELSHILLEDGPRRTARRIEQKRLKQLMKKKWTSKIPSRRVEKQGSGSCKRQILKTLSLIPTLRDQNVAESSRNSALYSFGPYPVKKDIVKIQTPVRAWKYFWDNIANRRRETVLRRDCSIKNKGLVKKGKSALQKLSQGKIEVEDAAQDDDRKRSIVHIEYNVVCIDETLDSFGAYEKRTLSGNWKSQIHQSHLISTVNMLVNRFESAKQLFTQMEKDCSESFKTKTDKKKKPPGLNKSETRWELRNLFQDFNQGLGKPGVANRLGVLASLQSVEPVFQIGGYEPHYPHLPISSGSHEISSIVLYSPKLSKCKISEFNELDDKLPE